jgi:hypothetical protein
MTEYILMKSRKKHKKWALKILEGEGHDKIINFG